MNRLHPQVQEWMQEGQEGRNIVEFLARLGREVTGNTLDLSNEEMTSTILNLIDQNKIRLERDPVTEDITVVLLAPDLQQEKT